MITSSKRHIKLDVTPFTSKSRGPVLRVEIALAGAELLNLSRLELTIALLTALLFHTVKYGQSHNLVQ